MDTGFASGRLKAAHDRIGGPVPNPADRAP